MQYSKIAFLATLLAPLVAAQDLSGLPSCALTPAISALGSTGCALTDVACICKDSSFLMSLETTVEAACDAADLATALQFAKTLCLTADVTLSIPSPSAVGPTTASSSAAPATTTPMMTTTPMASTTMTTTVPVVVPTTTAMMSSSAMMSSATPSSVVIVSIISDGQPQAPTNGSTLTTPTITPFKGAAATNKAQFAGVAMFVGAVGAAFAL